jgi:hypothetical protein
MSQPPSTLPASFWIKSSTLTHKRFVLFPDTVMFDGRLNILHLRLFFYIQANLQAGHNYALNLSQIVMGDALGKCRLEGAFAGKPISDRQIREALSDLFDFGYLTYYQPKQNKPCIYFVHLPDSEEFTQARQGFNAYKSHLESKQGTRKLAKRLDSIEVDQSVLDFMGELK